MRPSITRNPSSLSKDCSLACTHDETTTNKRSCCRHCLQAHLFGAYNRNQAAKTAWSEARRATISQNEPSVASLREQSRKLRTELERLRSISANVNVQVCRAAVQNEEKQATLKEYQESIASLLSPLEHWQSTLAAVHFSDIRTLRFTWAATVLQMHRLQMVDLPSRKKRLRGLAKIAGWPLPHSQDLYGVLPELKTALRAVASVTQVLSQCLAIRLPHPIVLQLGAAREDIVDEVTPKDKEESILWNNAAFLNQPSSTIPPSMDPLQVQQRIDFAQRALIAEDVGGTQYPLVGDDVALQLLQNNIVALAIRAGVPIDTLWPAQAMLLNLYALQVYCLQQVQGTKTIAKK